MKKTMSIVLMGMLMLLSVTAMAQDKSEKNVRPQEKMPAENTIRDQKTDKKSKNMDKSEKDSGMMLQREEDKLK
ncbi:hypothetical protein Dacet_2127 [Denitrovibrio acetiphilus DSM 12809]|uniref:Pentapeptide MXKDX repeat protein n=1 Tax=Denitrovibrio acetiphilus (strain DSM 12809 / NBRC 114555 / N2460) TaxID=522772 RepID=D4H298_DENA2|nr:hypothetical protein [Denitrovibrio acetiphilus]ADD68889.1 hypothetical protein Dacet_2127 [Denitrovibrio acetiphilus DSM 12809]